MDEEEVDGKIEKMWDKGFPPMPDELYPIYDLHLKGKDPKKIRPWVFFAALIERMAKSLKTKNIRGIWGDNRKRPKRLHKKICKRACFRHSSRKKNRAKLQTLNSARYIMLTLDMNWRSICEGKSPYMTDMMMDFMLNDGPSKLLNMMYQSLKPEESPAHIPSPPPPDAPPSTDSSDPAQP